MLIHEFKIGDKVEGQYNNTKYTGIIKTINEDDIAAMGHGGLCMNCKVCHYPVCSFGR